MACAAACGNAVWEGILGEICVTFGRGNNCISPTVAAPTLPPAPLLYCWQMPQPSLGARSARIDARSMQLCAALCAYQGSTVRDGAMADARAEKCGYRGGVWETLCGTAKNPPTPTRSTPHLSVTIPAQRRVRHGIGGIDSESRTAYRALTRSHRAAGQPSLIKDVTQCKT